MPGTPAKSSYRPLYWVDCVATLDLIQVNAGAVERGADGIGETALSYALLVYSDHDVDVQCNASIGSAQADEYSVYYPAVTAGAQTAFCGAAADYPPTGKDVGYWSFGIASSRPQTAYKDPDNPLGLDGFIYKFADSECRSNMLGDDAVWSAVTLADVF